jgi:cyanate permease
VKFARLSLAGLPPAALAAGVVLVAINLRPAAASMGPVLHRIESGTGLSPGWPGAQVFPPPFPWP